MSVLISPTPGPIPKGAGRSERANLELEVTTDHRVGGWKSEFLEEEELGVDSTK